MPTLEIVSRNRCFGGEVRVCRHASETLDCDMRFSVFIPGLADQKPVPLLWWLSGLTCTEENFTVKAGAYGEAARLGVAIIAPDTSPRGEQVADDASYDLGQGAGFYVDATERPWYPHFSMYSYITQELQDLVTGEFPVDADAQGISGHSMGGHGALMLGLRNPQIYKSISAFAPIVAPSQCPWGQKAFSAYLGEDVGAWGTYDSCKILSTGGTRQAFPPILVDQGEADQFLAQQLMPELLSQTAQEAGQDLVLRRQPGYDHSYFFIASFIGDHLAHHSAILNAG